MIIDSHAHTFPYLGGAPGFDRPDEFWALLQRGLAFHGQPIRRVVDNAAVPDAVPWRTDDPSPAGRRPADFRAGRHGRFLWTIDGVDYYKQYLPAWLAVNEAGAELIVALMDQAGVDRCVLQNDSYYGKLNDFFADCVHRYPARFIGTIHVDEDRAYTDASLAELERAAGPLGLRGLFFGPHQYWLRGHDVMLDDERMLAAFWPAAERLGLVVYWALSGGSLRDEAGYLDQARRIGRVLDRCPGLRSVLVGGVPIRFFDEPGTPLPPALMALTKHDAVCFEVVFPISVGRTEDYPFPSAQAAVRRLFDRLGPRRLVWGSDVPNVERHCTYTQSLTYLTRHCPFIPPADLALITGGNVARLFDAGPLAAGQRPESGGP